MSIPRPSWFSDDKVMVSTAPTCGLTKGGRLLPIVDHLTGKRVQVIDPETGGQMDAINDKLLADMQALASGGETETLQFVPLADVSMRCAVPAYYDRRFSEHFAQAMKTEAFAGFSTATVGQLVNKGLIEIRGGHGSPSQDQRIGEVPYIKVSDLRAGFVNINPTNRVPLSVAKKFWKGDDSGLRAYDLICPERTSKNIGDFCVLMPGQERIVTTKEMIVIRPTDRADFDAFYVLWALTLKIVRDQWRRIIFMQTNREDVGKRYLEIEIPIAPSPERAFDVSKPFRDYYVSIGATRQQLGGYLAGAEHHFFVSGAESPLDSDDPIVIDDIDGGEEQAE